MKLIESGKKAAVPIDTLNDLFNAIKGYIKTLGVGPDAIVCGPAQRAAWLAAAEKVEGSPWIDYRADGEKMRLHILGLPVYVVDANNFKTTLV